MPFKIGKDKIQLKELEAIIRTYFLEKNKGKKNEKDAEENNVNLIIKFIKDCKKEYKNYEDFYIELDRQAKIAISYSGIMRDEDFLKRFDFKVNKFGDGTTNSVEAIINNYALEIGNEKITRKKIETLFSGQEWKNYKDEVKNSDAAKYIISNHGEGEKSGYTNIENIPDTEKIGQLEEIEREIQKEKDEAYNRKKEERLDRVNKDMKVQQQETLKEAFTTFRKRRR
ncbi:MAG: hypothetical protein KBF93_14390 [Leptospiraceae bacterium]|nr:hypothetical protein [Leptospiraceae bacterium]